MVTDNKNNQVVGRSGAKSAGVAKQAVAPQEPSGIVKVAGTAAKTVNGIIDTAAEAIFNPVSLVEPLDDALPPWPSIEVTEKVMSGSAFSLLETGWDKAVETAQGLFKKKEKADTKLASADRMGGNANLPNLKDPNSTSIG